MQRSWRYPLYRLSYSPLCFKIRCHGNGGRSRVNIKKAEGEGKDHFAPGQREKEVMQVIWAKLMRRATALAVRIRRLSWFSSIHFDAIHSWNLRRSHKLQKKTPKTPILEIQGHRCLHQVKAWHYIACYDKQHVSADLQPFSSYTSQ